MFHRVKSEVPESDQKENQAPATGVYKREQPLRTPYSTMRDQQEERDNKEENVSAEAVQKEVTKQNTPESETTYTGYRRMTQEAEAQPQSPSQAPRTASYGAGNSYVPPQGPETASSVGERCLTIGRGINMSGEIEACDHLVVEGTVEAALKGSKVLEVAESGVFYGAVEIEEATIAGRFEGDITVNGRLTLHSTAVITGSIAYRELEVEAGAVMDGRMTPLKAAVDQKAADKYRAGSEASAMAKPTARTAKKSGNAANNESGLFTKVNTQY